MNLQMGLYQVTDCPFDVCYASSALRIHAKDTYSPLESGAATAHAVAVECQSKASIAVYKPGYAHCYLPPFSILTSISAVPFAALPSSPRLSPQKPKMPLQLANIPAHLSIEFRSPASAIEKGATIPELYDWHAKENPDYPLFAYHDGEKTEYITYSSANRAMDRAARYVLSGLGPLDFTAEHGAAKLPTVAIFAKAGTSELARFSSL